MVTKADNGKGFNISYLGTIIAVLVFLSSVTTTWYNNKSRIDLIERNMQVTNEKVDKTTKTLEANNLELINYKLDLIMDALEVEPQKHK